MKKNVIKDKSYHFAIRIINLYKYLKENKKEFLLSKQILRSGTSIGALIEEAIQAESKPDFVHKLSIALKEANETNYWLRLLKDTFYLNEKEQISILIDCEELQKLLTSIIKSSKINMRKNG